MRMGIGLGVGINRSNYAQGIFGAYATRVVADGGVVEGGACVDAVSGLLLSASLLLIPSGYKGGKLYSEIPTNGNGDFTWARTSTANRTNSSGNLELMATGVPRLSYMYGSCPAVLLEPQRTNLVLRSEEFDDAAWTKSGATVTANDAIAPDGTMSADKITLTSSSGRIARGVTLTDNVNYTASVFVKNIDATNATIRVRCTNKAGTVATANFILTGSGTISELSDATATITAFANNWYRCTLSFNAQSGATTPDLRIISNATGGLASGESVYGWGAQLEAGAYPTTYMPTTSATATRVTDSFSRNNIFTNGLITSSGGTWFVELRNNVAYLRDVFIFDGLSLIDSTNADGFIITGGSGSRLAIRKSVATTLTSLYTTTTDTVKIAIKWNGTSADIFVNGTKVVSATSFTATTSLQFLKGNGADVPKFIQQMALYPSPLSDTDCTTITSL